MLRAKESGTLSLRPQLDILQKKFFRFPVGRPSTLLWLLTTQVSKRKAFKASRPIFDKELAEGGIKVHTGTMVLRSLGTAIRDMAGGYSEQELIANTLRMFSQGVKVCVEIVAMAADSGLIPFDDVVAIAGTGRGADTACLIRANSSNRFFKIKIKELFAKPKET